jgi:hypothetical protein
LRGIDQKARSAEHDQGAKCIDIGTGVGKNEFSDFVWRQKRRVNAPAVC